MTLTKMESGWLDYARDVIACNPSHLEMCRERRQAWFPPVPSLCDSIRWPGNFGSAYEVQDFRVLVFGQIHLAGMLADSLGHLQPDMIEFRNGRLSPKDFLTKSQSAYESVMRGWGPWKKIESVLGDAARRLSLPCPIEPSHIAYSNIAKCWAPANNRNRSLKRFVDNQPTMQLCSVQPQFRPSRLHEILQPDFVLQIGRCEAVSDDDFGDSPRAVLPQSGKNLERDIAQAKCLLRLHSFAKRLDLQVRSANPGVAFQRRQAIWTKAPFTVELKSDGLAFRDTRTRDVSHSMPITFREVDGAASAMLAWFARP
jgi:hypothetical protein